MRAYLDQAAGSDTETVREVSDASLELRQRESEGGENDYCARSETESARDREAGSARGRGRSAAGDSSSGELQQAGARRNLQVWDVPGGEEIGVLFS